MAAPRTRDPVKLELKDWEEIYYALDSRARQIENGDEGECLEHGEECTACDTAWIEHLRRIMAAIGDDGADAFARGVIAE